MRFQYHVLVLALISDREEAETRVLEKFANTGLSLNGLMYLGRLSKATVWHFAAWGTELSHHLKEGWQNPIDLVVVAPIGFLLASLCLILHM